jgi:hydrogenase expression/formation protein HypE
MRVVGRLPKGKLRGEELRRIVLRHLPMLAEETTTRLDFSRVSRTSGDLIVSCDPIIGIPPYYYGFSAVHVPSADVAIAGVKPRYLELGVYYPPNYPARWLDRNMRDLGAEARRLGIKIIGGHTGGYDGLTLPLISSTCIGIVENRLLSPAAIRPSDSLIMSGPVAHELAIFLSFVETKRMEQLFGPRRVRELRKDIGKITVVEPALAAADAGARAMHDAAEGGTALALRELSDASMLGIRLDYDMIPWSEEGLAAAEAYGADPLSASSFGSFLVAVPKEHADDVIKSLAKYERPAQEVGSFTERKAVILKKGDRESRLEIREDIYGRFTAKL